MSAKMTPGPWTLHEHADPDIYGPDGQCIVNQVCSGANGNDDDGMANARAIAAVPDLIEALQAVLPRLAHPAKCMSIRQTEEWVKHGSVSFDGCQCEIAQARAALAKAGAL